MSVVFCSIAPAGQHGSLQLNETLRCVSVALVLRAKNSAKIPSSVVFLPDMSRWAEDGERMPSSLQLFPEMSRYLIGVLVPRAVESATIPSSPIPQSLIPIACSDV